MGKKHKTQPQWRSPREHENSRFPCSTFSFARNPETGHVSLLFYSEDGVYESYVRLTPEVAKELFEELWATHTPQSINEPDTE